MKFYNRESELELLKSIEELSKSSSQMTVLTGRRRIGKTKLLLKAAENSKVVYLFVSKKSETVLANQFAEEASKSLGEPIGSYSHIAELLEHLMLLSVEKPFTLIIDEFQELMKIDKSIIGDIQRVWDLNKDKTHLNLLVSGSVYSMMHSIFEDSKEPLFSRAGNIINLQPFKTDILKQILGDHNPAFSNDDLLALYCFTGGVAWYVELFMNAGATTVEKMINFIFRENSLFLNEGRNILIEEFGKEYGVYFSILECIARGINMRGNIESSIGVREIGGHLAKLENDYNIIRIARPVLSKESTKTTRYYISDNFLTFWFRFIYKYIGYVESGSLELLKGIVKRDYPTFSGIMLERYFRQRAKESGLFTHIGGFWDRKGENEIDIILINELSKHIEIGEIKRQVKNISPQLLSEKAQFFISLHPELQQYSLKELHLSLEEM